MLCRAPPEIDRSCQPAPSASAPLKSSVSGKPAAAAASRKTCDSGFGRLGRRGRGRIGPSVAAVAADPRRGLSPCAGSRAARTRNPSPSQPALAQRVEVVRVPAQVHHRVDAARPAERVAARPVVGQPAGARLRDGVVGVVDLGAPQRRPRGWHGDLGLGRRPDRTRAAARGSSGPRTAARRARSRPNRRRSPRSRNEQPWPPQPTTSGSAVRAGPIARTVKNLLQILVSHVAELLTDSASAFVAQGQVW